MLCNIKAEAIKMGNTETYTDSIEKALTTTIRKMMAEVTQHQALGITGGQFHLLNIIEEEGITNTKHLASVLNVKPSAVTVMIERLVKHGFVARNQDSNDRRTVLLSLTDDGRGVLNQARNESKSVLKKYISLLDEKEIHCLISIFEKFASIQTK